MSQIGYLFLGWLLGVLSMLVTRWLQAREEKQKKEIDIVSETLKYLFRTRHAYNNLLTDRLVVEKSQKEFPAKRSELERRMYEQFDSEISKDFFSNLMFHSFQLKRIEDKSFWKDFEILMGKYEALGKMVMEMEGMDRVSKTNEEVMTLTKTFVEKCIAKAKT